MKASFASTIKAGLSWLIPSKMEDRSTPSCSSTRTGRSSLTMTSPNRLRQRRQRLPRNNPKRRHKAQFRTKPWSFRPSLSMKMERRFPGSCEALTALSGIPERIPLRAPRGTMTRNPSFIFFIWAVFVISAFAQAGSPPLSPVHVATALNHLTVLEFHEPVTMAAAGSSDFQIERQEDKVFIKPIKPGAATDLFVWTASRRFAYELETTAEVKNMNVSVDNPLPPAPEAPPNSGFSAHVDELRSEEHT